MYIIYLAPCVYSACVRVFYMRFCVCVW